MYVAFSQDERFKRVKWEPILERKITIVDYSAVETKKNQRTNRKIKWLECRLDIDENEKMSDWRMFSNCQILFLVFD